MQPGENLLSPTIKDLLQAFPRHRRYLIPTLQAVQESLGYIPPIAMEQAARHLRISPSEVYGVVTFYAQFRLTPRGLHTIKVCRGTACHVRGGANVGEVVERELGVRPNETTADGKFTYEAIACFGACALAPVVVVDDAVHGHMTQDRVRRILASVG
jgi:NADH-quinone oxidoreductase subunit E